MTDAQAIILAAGRGSRLGLFTQQRPKALVELCGRPLLGWQLLALRRAGISDITAIGGYCSNLLASYLPITINPRWQSTNMVYSMLQFDKRRGGDLLVSYSDIAYGSTAVSALLASAYDIAITYDINWLKMWSARFGDVTEDAESFRVIDGLVVDVGRRVASEDGIEGQYMGLVKFSPRGWADCVNFTRALPQSLLDTIDMTGLLRRLVAVGHPVAAIPYNDPWCEVDSERDLLLYEQDARFGPLRTMLGELASCLP